LNVIVLAAIIAIVIHIVLRKRH